MSCIFCKIAAGEIVATVVYRDANIIAIEDVNPQAPVHVLVLPVRHAATLGDLVAAESSDVVRDVFARAAAIGNERSPQGFRTVVNTGELGGQTVDHVHVHVLGGRAMNWPPG